MIIIIKIAYIVFCVLFAKWNAVRCIQDKKIRHGINGAIHLILAFLIGYLYGWKYSVWTLFAGRVFFDAAINYFRFGIIDYVPSNPKSIVDQLEKKVFGNDKTLPFMITVFMLVIISSL